jgi:CRP/FNR family transcriptional regulator, cyclic AMP receptor protein
MENDVKYWYLRNHSLFSQLNGEEIRSLCIISGFKKAKKNEDIFFSQEEEKRVYFLKKGTLKIISVDAEGNEITKELLQRGDIFGEITLDDQNGDNENEFARAASPDVVVCSFTLKDFEKLLAFKPQLAIRYTKQVGFRLKTIETRLSDLIRKDVRTRLTEFLRTFAAQNGTLEGNTLSTRHFLTQQDIAHIIGASRQTVATLMNELTAADLLQYSRTDFIIPDTRALI